MITQPELMTTLSEAEWRRIKRAIRTCRHKQCLERAKEAAPAAWLAAIRRDDATDPAERELVLEEQAA